MTKQERAKQQWVKVCFRFADKKARVKEAKQFKARYGKSMRDQDAFKFNCAFSVDHCGFLGAFEKAKEYIADNKLQYGEKFEWQIDGGEW